MERRLSFSIDHLNDLIHPHRHRSRESKEKRRSLGHSRSSDRSSSHERNYSASPSANLDIVFESPPLVFYGPPDESSGALLSGRLRLSVADLPGLGEITLKAFKMRLVKTATNRKPVSKDCPNCVTQSEELNRWEFLSEPITLKHGDHEFPFSYLLPGNLPATSQGSLGSIDYRLSATAVTITGEEIRLQVPLKIQRAILPGYDRSSIRVFPPTNMTSRVVLPSVIHPIGSFPVSMTLNGIVEKSNTSETRWKLRKMMWRIEEHQKITSIPCKRHTHKAGPEGKGIPHQDTRIIGHDEEKDGWKTDIDSAGGEITLEFEAGIKPGCNPICDLVPSTDGNLEVKHNLVIELIIGEEVCPIDSTRTATPTGAARILRMLFHLNVTERSGLGISWDEEMPPVYDDVPASPPGYMPADRNATMEPYHGSPLPLPEYEESERMNRFESVNRTRNSSVSSNSRVSTRSSTRPSTGATTTTNSSLNRSDNPDLEPQE